jgi:4-hydroxybenzoate polyprenyltransferase
VIRKPVGNKLSFTRMLKAAFTHLRLPFSIFLAPVYFFALSRAHGADPIKAAWVFIILHLLLFPASNAYNSYYDRDEGSIGLIEKPPPVPGILLYIALGMDFLAVFLSVLLDLGSFFTAYLVVYGLASKAYSHSSVRLKKYPVASLLIVAFCQGIYTYTASLQAISGMSIASLFQGAILLPGLLCSVNLLAVYPITQVYQHEEDRKHGDFTYSRLVGIKGTFIHTAIFFTISFAGFSYLYISEGAPVNLLLFSVFMIPAVVFFMSWWFRVLRKESEANYRNTMRMNALASTGLNLFFILLCLI